jgi:hypothetical protein
MERTKAWREVGASEYLCRAIRFGIHEEPTVPFTEGTFLPPVPQTQEDLLFAEDDLGQGCLSGVYERVSRREAEGLRATGLLISSAFTV